MKTQLLIEDGRAQIVLTPETEFEKGIVGLVDVQLTASVVKRGEFAFNKAGFIREFDRRPSYESLIVVLSPKPEDAGRSALASMESGNGE